MPPSSCCHPGIPMCLFTSLRSSFAKPHARERTGLWQHVCVVLGQQTTRAEDPEHWVSSRRAVPSHKSRWAQTAPSSLLGREEERGRERPCGLDDPESELQTQHRHDIVLAWGHNLHVTGEDRWHRRHKESFGIRLLVSNLNTPEKI